jgi:pyruvate/2-oxoglutarate dehydrogenase complex dihydrolipoamide acyltransferase (E2) component
LRPGLEAGRLLLSRPTSYRLLQGVFGLSSAVTNVGSVVSLPKGARFRAASATIPSKLGHVASVFGVAPTEQAAVVDEGAVVAREVLPLVLIVDHRAVDGVLMAAAAVRVAEALLDPAGKGLA